MGYSIKRVDSNQKEIVKAARDAGASVSHTHAIGHGFPDVVFGVDGLSLIGNFDKQAVLDVLKSVPGVRIHAGVNFLVEIKDGKKSKSSRKLTPDEEKWHAEWKGSVVIVESEEETINLLNTTDTGDKPSELK